MYSEIFMNKDNQLKDMVSAINLLQKHSKEELEEILQESNRIRFDTKIEKGDLIYWDYQPEIEVVNNNFGKLYVMYDDSYAASCYSSYDSRAGNYNSLNVRKMLNEGNEVLTYYRHVKKDDVFVISDISNLPNVSNYCLFGDGCDGVGVNWGGVNKDFYRKIKVFMFEKDFEHDGIFLKNDIVTDKKDVFVVLNDNDGDVLLEYLFYNRPKKPISKQRDELFKLKEFDEQTTDFLSSHKEFKSILLSHAYPDHLTTCFNSLSEEGVLKTHGNFRDVFVEYKKHMNMLDKQRTH